LKQPEITTKKIKNTQQSENRNNELKHQKRLEKLQPRDHRRVVEFQLIQP
jgi:hypothetical protein